MRESESDNRPKPARRPRLHLPFEQRRSDVGEWAYDHRVGLCITVIAYLVLAIAFVAGRIVVNDRPHSETIYIDLQTLAELEAERDRLEQESRQRNTDNSDWRKIQNLVSNENAAQEGTEGSRSAAETAADEALRERMRANRDAYERGLAEERAIQSGSRATVGEGESDQRVRGRVTVSYAFADPVRRHRGRLEVPAYQCEGGGEVVVEAVLGRSGDVLTARVVSGGDDCMRETALAAARISRFNIDQGAPARQSGTIIYVFIPQ